MTFFLGSKGFSHRGNLERPFGLESLIMNIALCVCMYMYVCVTSVPLESPVCPSSGEAGHAGRTVSVTLDVLEASSPDQLQRFLLLLVCYFLMAHSDVMEEPVS